MAVRRKKAEEAPKPKDKMAIGKEVLKLLESVAEEKRISREVLFSGLETGIRLAAERHLGIEEGVNVIVDRATGEITARHGEAELDPEMLGRIAAQSAKQVIIQKFREAESDTVFNEYNAKKGDLIVGNVTRVDAGTAILSLGKTEALLPRSEQIPGETHHVGERVKAVIYEVRKTGHRVKIVLSRAHEDFVKSLFEEEIPEISDRTIEVRAVAREPGHRTKLAVSSIDMKVDCVGACVGVRGSRIKTIINELNQERIDIVRWNDSPQVLIPNALQPASISDVFTYPRLGRAIVLVDDDQLSLAIGRRGQNVRLASKLVRLDLEIMTHEELGEALERAERWFRQLPHVQEEHVQVMIEEGFLSYNDLTFIDGENMTEFLDFTLEQADEVIAYAEEYADMMDRAIEEERRMAAEAAKAQAIADEEAAISEENTEMGLESENNASTEVSEVEVEPSEAGEELNPDEGSPEVAEASAPTRPPVDNSYHEGMPTDTEGVIHAVEEEELRTGEDGELTTPAPDETDESKV